MNVQHVVASLQSLHAGLPGVVSAPLRFPGSLNSANLPTVITWPQRAFTTKVTARAIQIKSERLYSVRVYVEATGKSDYDIPSWKSMTMLPTFIEAYFKQQELADGYAIITRVDDLGLMAGGDLAMQAGLTYAGNAYKGFVLTLHVTEVTHIG